MVNKKYQGKLLHDLRDYDVNSLYPSVMYRDMPIGKGVIYTDESLIPDNYNLRLYEIYITSVRVIGDYIPFIPTTKSFIWKDSYSYNYKVEELEICLWGEEFELFKLYYEGEYNVIKILAYKSKKDMFKSYLDTFKEIKENAPNPSPERTFAKQCMNSLYGKFAQNCNRVSKVPYLDKQTKEVKFELVEHNGEQTYDRKIASIITSYARCVLIKAINKNPKRFVYCDTDSIYVLGDYDYDIPVDSKKLGFWKYEYSYDNFKALKAKCYISTIKGTGELHSAVAGLPKECQKKLNFKNFKNGLVINDAKKQLCRVKGGIVIVPIPFTIKIEKEDTLASDL